jgi:hypothetical protein
MIKMKLYDELGNEMKSNKINKIKNIKYPREGNTGRRKR